MIICKLGNERRTIGIDGPETSVGETLTELLRKKTENKEKVEIQVDTYYTEKRDGVLDALNIRADRFDIGLRESERIQSYRDKKKEHLQKTRGVQEAQQALEAEEAKTVEGA